MEDRERQESYDIKLLSHNSQESVILLNGRERTVNSDLFDYYNRQINILMNKHREDEIDLINRIHTLEQQLLAISSKKFMEYKCENNDKELRIYEERDFYKEEIERLQIKFKHEMSLMLREKTKKDLEILKLSDEIKEYRTEIIRQIKDSELYSSDK